MDKQRHAVVGHQRFLHKLIGMGLCVEVGLQVELLQSVMLVQPGSGAILQGRDSRWA